jgi:hypothetical protein
MNVIPKLKVFCCKICWHLSFKRKQKDVNTVGIVVGVGFYGKKCAWSIVQKRTQFSLTIRFAVSNKSQFANIPKPAINAQISF